MREWDEAHFNKNLIYNFPIVLYYYAFEVKLWAVTSEVYFKNQ